MELLVAESDEDIEVETSTVHHYAQVKCWADALQPNEVRPILERFDRLRTEHAAGRRPKHAQFAIVSGSEASPSLARLMEAPEWPNDVRVITPGNGLTLLGVPAWKTLANAIDWTVEAARRVPFCRLAPGTLVWKLAAHVQMLASGRVYGGSHAVEFSELTTLREQLNLFADVVPPPPSPYRPQRNEPPIASEARARLIVGVSGSGKSSWFSSASAHFPSTVVFMRASPGIAEVPSWLVRHLAATLLQNANETISAVFRPGAVAEESLRLLDRLAERSPITVVVDSAHLLDPAALGASIRDTSHLRWIVLAQPGPQTTELGARLGVAAEALDGWTVETVASALADLGVHPSPQDAARLRDMTAGLPLFVEGAARTAKEHYGGDLPRLLDEQSRGAHVAELPQETIIARDVIRHLTEGARTLAALASSVRSDVPLELLRGLGAAVLSLGGTLGRSIRELTHWSVLRPGPSGYVGIHDAFRPALDSARAALDPTVRGDGLRHLLDGIRGLRAQGAWSVDLLMDMLRLLADLGDADTLVNVIYGGVEWLREYGAAGDAELLLAEALDRPGTSERFQFLGADTLAYLSCQRRDASTAQRWIERCERIAKRQILANPDWEARLAVKRILLAGVNQDYEAAKRAFDEYDRWAESGTEGHRVARYDLAVAAFAAKEMGEAARITTDLINEYYELLDLGPPKLFRKNIRDLAAELDIEGNEDEIRHLADSLQLRASVAVDVGSHPAFDPPWAMKLYALVGANSSAMRSGLEWANATVKGGAITEGLKIFEEQLVPLIESEHLMEWIVPVYFDYARALARAGRFRDAHARMRAAQVFVPALSEQDRALYGEIEREVGQETERRDRAFAQLPDGLRRIDRQRYDGHEPFRHPASVLVLEEMAWFERADGTAIGVLLRDKTDDDYGWIVQRADEDGKFTADDMKVSVGSPETAAEGLMKAMLRAPLIVPTSSLPKRPQMSADEELEVLAALDAVSTDAPAELLPAAQAADGSLLVRWRTRDGWELQVNAGEETWTYVHRVVAPDGRVWTHPLDQHETSLREMTDWVFAWTPTSYEGWPEIERFGPEPRARTVGGRPYPLAARSE
ncbi:MAG: hypothetical protein QM820_04585 [Minicystis sp.]